MSDELEGTPEFNRRHREIVADLNDRGLREQPDMSEYRPSPILVDDDREGFDADGNWHAFRAHQRGEHEPNIPYRLAMEMQEGIQAQVAMYDYTVGLAERNDMAIDIANEWFNAGTFEPHDLAFEALNRWRQIYGREA